MVVIFRLISLSLVVLMSTLSIAQANELTASVDRNQVYESETLTLILEKQSTLSGALGGLLSFRSSVSGGPDISDLSDDFDILDQSQRQNVQQINGQGTSVTTWSYLLLPKRPGILSIPSFEFDGVQSNAISIEVLAGKKPRDANRPPDVFVELVSDKSEVFVQEQMILTVRLYAAYQLASGELSAPELTDAIVEQVGDTEKYFKMAFNRRYEVRERIYAVFPQASGEMTVDPVRFQGVMINTNTRQRLRVLETSEPIVFSVKSPPAEFTGSIWLPAINFTLQENWDVDPQNLAQGDSATRSIISAAIGLMSPTLPPIEVPNLSGLKLYPDQPELIDEIHELGVASARTDATAMIAIESGEHTLPAIRIPWWDTVNNVEKIASIPARTVSVASAIKSSATAGATAGATAVPMAEDEPVLAPSTSEVTGNLNDASEPDSEDHSDHVWIIVLMGIGWFVSVLALLMTRNRSNSFPARGAELPSKAEASLSIKQLQKLYNQSDADLVRQVLIWLNAQSNLPTVRTINEVEALNPSLALLLRQHESNQARHTDYPIDGKAFDKAMRAFSITKNNTTHTGLAPFYPA